MSVDQQAATITSDETPLMMTPSPIFVGVDGSLLRVRSQANRPTMSGVSTMIQNGFTDWKISVEIKLRLLPSLGQRSLGRLAKYGSSPCVVTTVPSGLSVVRR